MHNYTTEERIHSLNELGYAPFPLPYGDKYPPAKNATGGIPNLTEDQISKLWDGASDQSNIGIRLQKVPNTDFALIVVDVDQYDKKTGWDNLEAVCSEQGLSVADELSKTVRVSRRGADSKSGHYYFKAPAGIAFKGLVCESVEVLQMGHRYAVAPGSIVGSQEYKVYKGTTGEEVSELPPATDLPELPKKLFDLLQDGRRDSKPRPKVWYGAEPANKWLVQSAPRYNAQISADVVLTSFPPENFEANGHDTMNNAVHFAVRRGVLEGRPGLGCVLDEIQKRFFNAVADRRPEAVMKAEFARSLNGEIELIRGEVDAGKATLFIDAMTEDQSTLIDDAQRAREELEALHSAVFDIASLSGPPKVAELLASLNPSLFVIESAKGALEVRSHEPMSALSSRKLRAELDSAAVLVMSAFATLDDDADEHLCKRCKLLLAGINTAGNAANLTPLTERIANAAEVADRLYRESEVNANANLIGVGNEVLDLALVKANPRGELTDWLRPRTMEDKVTRSIEYPHNIRAGWEKFKDTGEATRTQRLLDVVFPDPVVRDFALSVFGYCLYGANPAHKVFVMHGPGGSGKNTVTELIKACVGRDYFSEIKLAEFQKAESAKPDPAYTASLRTRLTFVDEAEKPLSGASLKLATQTRHARALYSNDVVESAANTLLFATNHVFAVNRDSGVDRRLMVLPFTAKEEEVKAARSGEWMYRSEERAYMLYLLAQGMHRAVHGDALLNAPEAVQSKTSEFLAAADELHTIITELLEFTGDKKDQMFFDAIAAKVYPVRRDQYGNREPLTQEELDRIEKILSDHGAKSGSQGRVTIDGKTKKGFRGVRLKQKD